MSTLFALLLPLAGCATMMFVCSRMMRGGKCATPDATADETTQLRAEIAGLREEVARLRTLDEHRRTTAEDPRP